MIEKRPGTKKTHKEYVAQVKSLEPKKWLKVIDKYINDGTKIRHKCINSHIVEIRPHHVIKGVGCNECAKKARGLKRRKSQGDYVTQVNKIHENTIFVEGVYKGAFIKIVHKCLVCSHRWKASPDNVVNTAKTGCPNCCRGRSYSKKAIRWLKSVAKERGIKIQHAEWGGEYIIPGTKLKVDGFHKESKTVFEFHGDCFHGNPNKYKPNAKCHPFSNVPAKTLYKRTIDRENYIRSLGYTVVSIWESEYDEMCKG